MIRDLKIGKKLFLLSITLMVSLVIVGGSSLILMNKINNSTTIMSENWLPSVITSEEINTKTSDYRILELGHIMSEDSQKTEYDSKINSAKTDLNNTIAGYEDLITNETDRKLIETIKEQWNEYISISEQVLTLSRNKETDRATEVMREESRELFDELSANCLQLAEFNKEGASTESKKSDQRFWLSMVFTIVIFLVSLALGIILSIIIVRLIVKPVNSISHAAKEIAKGNLDVSVDYESKDEIGDIVKAFSEMNIDLKMIIQDIQYLLGAMAEGNFLAKTNCQEKYVGEYSHILDALHTINRTLSKTLTDIDVASDQVALGSEQVSNGAQELSQGATEQASSVEELSTTVTEIAQQVTENAKNARLASNSAELAGKEISTSNEHMKSMVQAMDEISTKSTEISKIIKVIEDIAFQTNILALNAAVEAARAGDAGKGFAVVAEEVRNLASKSADAAKDTTRLIEESISAVQNGSKLADVTAQALNESSRITLEAITLIDKIAEASNYQSQSISQVNIGVEQISAVVQTNSATAEESAAASEELSGQAQMLKNLISKFKLNEEKEIYNFGNTNEEYNYNQEMGMNQSKY